MKKIEELKIIKNMCNTISKYAGCLNCFYNSNEGCYFDENQVFEWDITSELQDNCYKHKECKDCEFEGPCCCKLNGKPYEWNI